MSLSLDKPYRGYSSMLDYLNSEEGQRGIKEYADKLKARWDRAEAVLLRFHEKFKDRIPELIERVLSKYNEDSYVLKWYQRGIEPPEPWLWQLFEYAEHYGEEIDPKNIAVLDRLTMFTTEAYTLEGYLFERLDGQGSVIHITKL